jgi:hypothetical protein
MSMPDLTQCEECQAIVEELRAVGAEVRSTKAGEQLQACGEDLLNLMRGNAAAADELLAKFPFRPQIEPFQMPQRDSVLSPRIRSVARKLIEHQTRTGHRVMDLFRKKRRPE